MAQSIRRSILGKNVIHFFPCPSFPIIVRHFLSPDLGH